MRGMSWVGGVICVLGWTVVGSAQIPGYAISPTNIQLSSRQTQQSVVIVPQSSSTPFQFQTTVTTMSGGAWLVTVPQSIGPAVGVQAFTVVANLSGLVVGLTYTGTVRVTIGSQWQDISVTLAVPSPVTRFVLSPSIANLSANQPTQVISIVPSGTALYDYMATTITTTASTWLSVTPASGTATGATNFTVIANPAGLQAGVHVGTVRVVVNNWQQDLPVTLTVSSSGGASVQVTPTSLSFEYTRGGAPPPLQKITIQSNSAMIYTASIANATADFLRVSQPAGTTFPGLSLDIIVQPPPSITLGVHTAEIKVQSTGQPTVTVNVTLVVTGPPPPCTSMPLSVALNAGQMQSSVRISTGTNEPKLYSIEVLSNPPWLSTNDPGGTIMGSKDIVVQAVRQPGMQAGAVYTSGLHIVMAEGSCLVPISYATPAEWPLAILNSSMRGLTVGSTYDLPFSAEGGGKPYHWSQTGLPDGLTLDAWTGVVHGTPTKADSFLAKITVRDSIGGIATADFPIAVQRENPQKLSFVSMKPCRVMETRAQYNFEGRTGAFGPPFLNGMETRTLTLPASNVCSIPATAQAFVLNVTAIPRGALDYVAVYAGDESQPQLRTVSSPDGQVIANSALVRAGSGGTIKVAASHNTDLLIDISGYFATPGTNPGLTYYPVSPCRAVETRAEYRSGTGLFGPPGLNAGETRRFRLPDSPWCKLPQGAAAYSATITVVPKGPLPFLTMWPSGTGQPNVSSINSFAGRVLSNSVILPAGADGSIDVFAFDRTDLLIDVNGYFAPDDGVKGLYFAPGVPCRITGPRPLPLGNETAQLLVMGLGSPCAYVSSTVKAYALHVTAMPAGSQMPFLTLFPAGEPRPNASVLNAFEGQTVTNSVIVPTGGSGGVSIYAYRATNVVVERVGYFWR